MTHLNSNPLLAKILDFEEGDRLEAYKDSLGNWTIGRGINLENFPLISRGLDRGFPLTIAGSFSDQLFLFAIDQAESDVERVFPWVKGLDDVRYCALVNMAYCMGVGDKGLGGFRRLLSALESGDYTRAGFECLDSKWALQAPNRAARTAQMLSSGKLPAAYEVK